MASNAALAYLTDYSTLQYYQTQLNCKLVVRLCAALTLARRPAVSCSRQGPAAAQVAGDPFGPGNLALGLRKGSPYKAALNNAMITLRGNGFIDVLRRQWLPADFCSSTGSQASQAGRH